jgi:hypothetical protein
MIFGKHNLFKASSIQENVDATPSWRLLHVSNTQNKTLYLSSKPIQKCGIARQKYSL